MDGHDESFKAFKQYIGFVIFIFIYFSTIQQTDLIDYAFFIAILSFI